MDMCRLGLYGTYGSMSQVILASLYADIYSQAFLDRRLRDYPLIIIPLLYHPNV